MTWTHLSDDWTDNPKIGMVSELASLLWIKSMTYCNRLLTDGFVPASQLRKMTTSKHPERLAAELVSAIPPGYEKGLWVPCEGGWMVSDFLVYNDSRAKVVDRKKAAAERQNLCRSRKASHGDEQGDSHCESLETSHSESHSDSASDSPCDSHSASRGRTRGDRDRSESALALEGVQGEPSGKRGRKKPETAMPEDWAPVASHYEKGKTLGMSRAEVDSIAEHFRLKAKLKSYRYSDWGLAFHCWITSPLQQQGRPAGGFEPDPSAASARRVKQTQLDLTARRKDALSPAEQSAQAEALAALTSPIGGTP